MRLRPPPITDNADLNSYLRSVYNSMILIFANAGSWEQRNVAAGQAAVSLNVTGSTTNTEITLPVFGNIVGISVASNTPRTNGTLSVRPVINGAASTSLSAELNGTNTQYGSSTGDHEENVFESNWPIGVNITTSGTWAPVAADIIVNLFIKTGRS